MPSILIKALNKNKIKINSNTDLKTEYFNLWDSFKRVAKPIRPSDYLGLDRLKNICSYYILLDEKQSELVSNAVFVNLHSFLLQIADLIISYKNALVNIHIKSWKKYFFTKKLNEKMNSKVLVGKKSTPRIELEKKFIRLFKDTYELEDLNFKKLIEFKSLEGYSIKYNITFQTVQEALKSILFSKYGKEKGKLFYKKIAKFNLRRRWLTNDYIKIYLELSAIFEKLLPDNPRNIDFSKFNTYAEYNKKYGITASNNILYETLLEKYESRYGQCYVDKLHKKFGERFRNRYYSRISKKRRVNTNAFLRAAYHLMSQKNILDIKVNQVLTEIGYKDAIHLNKRRSFEKALKLLEMLQDLYKYRTVNDLYDEFAEEFDFHEDTTRRYLKNIAYAIPKYRKLKVELGYRGHPYSKLNSVTDFADYLNSVIMQDIHFFEKIKDDYGFIHHKSYAPLRIWLKKYGYRRFSTKLYELGIDYQDVISHANLRPLYDNRLQALGRMEHWCNIRHTLQHLRDNWKIHVYYEVISKLGKRTYNLNRPDVSVIIENSFKDYIFLKQDFIKFTNDMKQNIRLFNIEFYHGTDINKLIEKSQKGYQGKHKFLIIVLTGSNKEGNYFLNKLRRSKALIPIFEHIKILNLKEFISFIRFSYYHKKILKNNIELFGKGTYSDYYFDQLKDISEINEKELKEIFPLKYKEDLSTDGWIKYLTSLKLTYIVKDNVFPKTQKQIKLLIN